MRSSQRLQLRQALQKLDHCVVFQLPLHAPGRSIASKPSRVTRIKLLKSLRRTLFGPNAEVKRAPKRIAKKRKAKSVKEEDEESDGVPPRPKAKAKAKVKSKAMPRPRGTVRGFFDARRGRRVEVPLRGPNEALKPRMMRAFSGFSFRPVRNLKRRICGNYGHVAASCIQGQRSVSLTTGKIQLSQRIDPKSDEDLRGDALPNYGFENPLSSQISPGDSVSQVGYTPVAPKYALPIPTAPGMSADERLRLLLKKRKSEEPQRRHQSYETSDEVWPRDDGEEADDLKEELRRKRKRLEMKPFTKENRERPSYMSRFQRTPARADRNTVKRHHLSVLLRYHHRRRLRRGLCHLHQRRRRCQLLRRPLRRSQLRSPRLLQRKFQRQHLRARLQRVRLQRHQYLFRRQSGLNLPRPLQRWLQRLRVKPFDQLAQLWSMPLQLRQSRSQVG